METSLHQVSILKSAAKKECTPTTEPRPKKTVFLTSRHRPKLQ